MRVVTQLACLVLPALVGCGMMSQVSGSGAGTQPGGKAVGTYPSTYSGPKIRDLAHYERIAARLENHEELFRKAGYQRLWTHETNAAAGARLPRRTSVMPQEFRGWRPEFRQQLKDGERVLPFAEVLRVRETVALFVYNDSRSKFHVPQVPGAQRDDYWASRIDAIVQDAFKAVGVEAPSTTLRQLAIADGVNHWVMTHLGYSVRYRDAWFNQRRFPTGNEVLGRPDGVAQCTESAIAARDILRAWELKNQTGLEAYGVDVSRAIPGNIGGHAILGISLGNNPSTKLFYDSVPYADSRESGVPWVQMNPQNLDKLLRGYKLGPITAAEVELYAATFCVQKTTSDPNRPPVKFDTGNIGNDPQGPMSSFGNYVFDPNRVSPNPEDWKKELPREQSGWRPWKKSREENWPSIVALTDIISGVYDGK